MTFDLSRVDIKFLPGVGPKRAELLKAEAVWPRSRICFTIFLINTLTAAVFTA